MKRKTKILATVGPASDSLDMIIKLINAGVNVFRLNFSHGTHEYHKNTLENIREAMRVTKKTVGVLQDICGPKIRLVTLKEPFMLKEGDTIIFDTSIEEGYQESEKTYVLNINHPEILLLVKEGEFIFLCDGSIRVRVDKLDKTITATVMNSGKVQSNKGVNFPNTKININVITEKDVKDMLWGIENDVDFMAISFVQNASDMLQAREIINKNNGTQQLFAKIEKFDAVDAIDEIIDVSDGIMVARGDLGIEVPYYKVPIIQKEVIKKANEKSKPVITATQMLLSMTEKEMATRAEISDVANAVLDGTDAVMLSEESAVGNSPVNVVVTMSNTIMEAESIYPYKKYKNVVFHDDTDTITFSTTRLAENIKARAIFALTGSGQSARKMARYRPTVPIWAVTHSEKAIRHLTIVWGVVPVMNLTKQKLPLMISELMNRMQVENGMKVDETYVLTAGYPVGVPGSTNFIRILRESEIEYYTKEYELDKN
jgi:pyruvate kinase